MRTAFDAVFRARPDGTFAARQPTVVGGVVLARGVDFGRRVRIGAVHFAAVAGCDLEVEVVEGTVRVLHSYVPPPEQRPPPPPPRPFSTLLELPV